uniref:Death domain-containing protein n=1 Tax=Amphimedon queenslandica TaxID=400682 RepID=A0A1X7SZN7_AMPQE
MKLVRDVLKKSHFINANWFDLGEELNLPYPQLKNIEDTYVNNPSRCLRECLNLWLTSANNRTWESLASALERMNQCTAARHIRKITTNTVPSAGGEFFFNAAHKPIFNEVRGSFIILCDELVPLISQSKATVTEVKSFLLKSFPELSAELSNADSIEDIMNVVVQKCCINDISIIKTIVKKFQITEAKPLISEYEKEVKTVCGSLKDFLSLNQPEYFNHSETIQFTLGWQPEEHSLDDIRNLLEEAFKELNKRIIIRSIHRGNSIIIICYAPHHLLAALLLEAQHNLTVLMKEFSLIRLTIGHYTVYDKRIRYKVMNNECLAEEIKLADGKEQELRTLFDYKEGVIVDLLLNY